MTEPQRTPHWKAAALGLGFGILAMLLTDVVAESLWLFGLLCALGVVVVVQRRRTHGTESDTLLEAAGLAPGKLTWLKRPAFWLAFAATIAFGIWQAWCLTCAKILDLLAEAPPA